MNERTWLEHTVYMVDRNERTGDWEAAILQPTSQVPMLLTGEKTSVLTVEKVRAIYGECADRLPYDQFQAEVECRITHSEEMLALLKNNWTGQDLSGWHVYCSTLRPMTGIKIDGAIYLNGNKARYQEHYEVYTYVVVQEPLDEKVKQHYTLVTISHP